MRHCNLWLCIVSAYILATHSLSWAVEQQAEATAGTGEEEKLEAVKYHEKLGPGAGCPQPVG